LIAEKVWTKQNPPADAPAGFVFLKAYQIVTGIPGWG
jgi:hypothetical protein